MVFDLWTGIPQLPPRPAAHGGQGLSRHTWVLLSKAGCGSLQGDLPLPDAQLPRHNQEPVAMLGDNFNCHHWGWGVCSWHRIDPGHGCFQTSYNAQDSPYCA